MRGPVVPCHVKRRGRKRGRESRIGVERIREWNRTDQEDGSSAKSTVYRTDKRTWRLGRVDGRLSSTIEEGRERQARHLI